MKLKLFLWQKWRLVRWSCYWCVFEKLKSNLWCLRNWKMTSLMSVTISPFTCSLGNAKNFACRLSAFLRESLMNEVNVKEAGFWSWNVSDEFLFQVKQSSTWTQIWKYCSFVFDENQLKQRKISSIFFVVVLTSSTIKIPGMPFSIFILAIILHRSPRKKFMQETNTIFRGTLTTQATYK